MPRTAPCAALPPALPCSAAFHAVRESLKWKAKDAEAVDALHATAPELVAVYRQLCGQPDSVPGGVRRVQGWAGAGGGQGTPAGPQAASWADDCCAHATQPSPPDLA